MTIFVESDTSEALDQDAAVAPPPEIAPLPELAVGPAYAAQHGTMYKGKIEELLDTDGFRDLEGQVQLLFTSPPFPLNRKKRYGNETGAAYLRWLARLAPKFARLLKPDGSIVIEMGNAWEPGSPVMSVLALRALLAFMKQGKLFLCQQFVCDNPARLPGPVEWVNKQRVRVKDSFTHVWWMSPTERPKADNRRVLRAYSEDMRKLLETRMYNAGKRPSGWHIGRESFFRDNGGAIPSNCLSFANTQSDDEYQRFCRASGLKPHPARMPSGLAEFFIKFLTEQNDLVLDPFAGSNVTGAAAEALNRRWVSAEAISEYVFTSQARFRHDRIGEGS